MYDHPYLMSLEGKMRHKELLDQAEQARLIKRARQNRPTNRSLGPKIIAWARARLSAHQQGEEMPSEVLPISDPCCTSAES